MALRQERQANLHPKFTFKFITYIAVVCFLLWGLWCSVYKRNFLELKEFKKPNLRKNPEVRKNNIPAFLPFYGNANMQHQSSKAQIDTMVKKGNQSIENQQYHSYEDLKPLAVCPLFSPLLTRWIDVSYEVSKIRINNRKIIDKLIRTSFLKPGGKYQPRNCRSQNKVAVVVPYRKRKEQLEIFLSFMHPFLQKQQLEYTIFVVEQSGGSPFNRGMLMNIGFTEALLQEYFQCFIFHDVDLLPESDANFYACPEDGRPRHMAFLVDIFEYKLTPIAYFGGVSALSTRDFHLINGFSNVFWGWGGEDDDLYQRILFYNLTIIRSFDEQNSLLSAMCYRTLYHHKAKPNLESTALVKEGKKRFFTDGLSDLNYRKPKILFKPLYTHIIVYVQQYLSS